jgi:hypothetical protein
LKPSLKTWLEIPPKAAHLALPSFVASIYSLIFPEFDPVSGSPHRSQASASESAPKSGLDLQTAAMPGPYNGSL